MISKINFSGKMLINESLLFGYERNGYFYLLQCFDLLPEQQLKEELIVEIITLVENTSVSEVYKARHGMSFYIETGLHKILFDLGPDELFLENAGRMGVNIADVDTVVISHGHIDHGGGLKSFLEKNNKAQIYIRENGFRPHSRRFMFMQFAVGLNKKLESNNRIVFTGEDLVIDNELEVFSGVTGTELISETNKSLYEKIDGKYVCDPFLHEQNLIISEGDNKVLMAGCAHHGIVNIVNKGQEITGSTLTHAISGMHMVNSVDEYVNRLGARLMDYRIQYYTCHCTGQKEYEILHRAMGEQIQYAATGSVMEI
jgi:7,8-dihydropterin-6-yl-methyl-4-(beta-D-ribofuranosyl)aminobenzene 5'-phosphate synthase